MGRAGRGGRAKSTTAFKVEPGKLTEEFILFIFFFIQEV